MLTRILAVLQLTAAVGHAAFALRGSWLSIAFGAGEGLTGAALWWKASTEPTFAPLVGALLIGTAALSSLGLLALFATGWALGDGAGCLFGPIFQIGWILSVLASLFWMAMRASHDRE